MFPHGLLIYSEQKKHAKMISGEYTALETLILGFLYKILEKRYL